MVKARVTLADVARTAGVSSTAASLVLSGRGQEMRISREVQERVLQAAGDLDYRRNIVSVGLRTGRTGTLGFVSDTVATSQLAGNMIKGALDRARELDLMLLIGESGGDPGVERRLLDSMGDRQVDGLVVASMYTRERPDPTASLHVPAVLLNAVIRGGTAVPTVLPDEVRAGYDAARLLLDAGHRDGIWLVGIGTTPGEVHPDAVAGAQRLQGITRALGEVGAVLAGGAYFGDPWTPPHARDAVAALLGSARPTALICFNDHLAMGAYQALADAGLRIPQDVSVIGFDDVPLASWLRPELTTIALPHHELGARAVELLVDVVEGRRPPQGDPPVLRLPMPVVRRGSVGPPPR